MVFWEIEGFFRRISLYSGEEIFELGTGKRKIALLKVCAENFEGNYFGNFAEEIAGKSLFYRKIFVDFII